MASQDGKRRSCHQVVSGSEDDTAPPPPKRHRGRQFGDNLDGNNDRASTCSQKPSERQQVAGPDEFESEEERELPLRTVIQPSGTVTLSTSRQTVTPRLRRAGEKSEASHQQNDADLVST
ncbi:hypothetical protein PM082_010000 [Marasmius tenuissimus]|nr:hypothetical protein PM082_010000 [Marasmius tenuissimus]